jgi:hypothetical protein
LRCWARGSGHRTVAWAWFWRVDGSSVDAILGFGWRCRDLRSRLCGCWSFGLVYGLVLGFSVCFVTEWTVLLGRRWEWRNGRDVREILPRQVWLQCRRRCHFRRDWVHFRSRDWRSRPHCLFDDGQHVVLVDGWAQVPCGRNVGSLSQEYWRGEREMYIYLQDIKTGGAFASHVHG